MSKKSRQMQADADLINWVRSLKPPPPKTAPTEVKVTDTKAGK